MRKAGLFGVFGVIGIIVLVFLAMNSLFVVREWDQALVVQLGKPVRTVTEPGLDAKLPFVQRIIRFDKRILEYDASPKELLTQDKQQLVVDNYSRWRIVDPLLFYQRLRTEAGAQSRLDDIIYSDLRETLGKHAMTEIVSDRRQMMQDILANSQEKAQALGIELIDVRIKRVDLPEKNEQNVFQRMRTERERQAKKFRAEGQEEAKKITSEAERERQIILAEADRKSSIIRGQGEAEATKIYASAYNRDPEFYSFLRTLQSYEKSFTEETTFVLSPQTEFFRYLKGLGMRTAR